MHKQQNKPWVHCGLAVSTLSHRPQIVWSLKWFNTPKVAKQWNEVGLFVYAGLDLNAKSKHELDSKKNSWGRIKFVLLIFDNESNISPRIVILGFPRNDYGIWHPFFVLFLDQFFSPSIVTAWPTTAQPWVPTAVPGRSVVATVPETPAGPAHPTPSPGLKGRDQAPGSRVRI